MSVEKIRNGWMTLFTQMRRPTMFLSRSFTIKPGNVYQGGKVSIDIERISEEVAVVITAFTGPNLNDFSEFTTKTFTPPAYGEAVPVNVSELLERMAGVDPFTAAYNSYAGQLVSLMNKRMVAIYDKIRRAVELQASQILQTGTLDLTNKNGQTVYSLDFQPKASHFPVVATAWSDPASDPLGDLENLADVIRADGQIDANELYMGKSALKNFLAHPDVQAELDNRRIDVGMIRPEFTNSGATFYGYVWVGNYRFEIWGYPATYKHPQTGAPTPYIGNDNVIMKSRDTRLDMTSAAVPLPLGPDPRVASIMPGRMVSSEEGFDVTPNLYCTPNGKQIMGELESRPLLVPVQIDGFGCLDTTP